MGKKFVMVGGKKVYLKMAEEPAQTDPDEVKIEEEAEAPAGDVEAEAKQLADSVVKQVMAQIGVQNKKNDIEINATISKILNGKDLSDKNNLTAEEKIVGFYHALMTKNFAVCKALSEGTAADGGYLFPDEFYAELVKSLTGPYRMRTLVRVVKMNRDVMKIPTLVSRPKVYWTDENETKTTTSAEFYEATLTARKLAAIIYSSDELIEDSKEIDVVRTIIDLFSDAIADEEDRVILAGNGTTQPTGIVTAVAASTIASRACVGNLDLDDIMDLIYDLPQAYRQRAVMIASRANMRELRKLKDSNGQYLWQPSAQQGQPDRLAGYPIYENDYVGDATIVLGDLKMLYWLGDRKEMTVKISQDTETAFTKDQTAIRVVERIAGNVVLADAARAIVSIP